MGEIHFVTSLIFDIGVYLVVIGVMLDSAQPRLRDRPARGGGAGPSPPSPSHACRGPRPTRAAVRIDELL